MYNHVNIPLMRLLSCGIQYKHPCFSQPSDPDLTLDDDDDDDDV
jgi:hypothetical protein